MNGRTGLRGLILKICDLASVNGAIRDVRKQEGTACKILKEYCVTERYLLFRNGQRGRYEVYEVAWGRAQ